MHPVRGAGCSTFIVLASTQPEQPKSSLADGYPVLCHVLSPPAAAGQGLPQHREALNTISFDSSVVQGGTQRAAAPSWAGFSVDLSLSMGHKAFAVILLIQQTLGVIAALQARLG